MARRNRNRWKVELGRFTDSARLGLGTRHGLPRVLGCIATTALLIFLGWQIVANTLPQHFEGAQDARIDITAGHSSASLVRRVERQIFDADGAADWADVRRTAQEILRVHPLESRAFVLLGLAAEAEGQEDRAATLMGVAAARSLRNRGAHLWLFNHRLKQQEFEAALNHADVILRTRPQLGATLLPALMAVASIPEARPRLIEMLETDPPWRSWFLSEFSRLAADPSGPSPLYGALQAGPHPPSSRELRPHLDRLIGSDRFEQALVVWLNTLTPAEVQDLDYLSNGDFEYEISNLPFDWVISQVGGAEIDISESPFGRGKALRVQFAKARIPFKHVSKLVVLPPGAYQLSGTAKAVDLRNERGLVWNLTCTSGSKEVLATTAPVTGTMNLVILQQFTVPSQGCRAQWLQLELAARIPPEQDVGGGIVWYDSLQIRRIDAPAPS